MRDAMAPSTQWREDIAADEDVRCGAYAAKFAAIQARKSRTFGPGRALHRKQLGAAKGRLEVLANLPEFARHGLFAAPAALETWVRLSNGGIDRAADHVPDIRGLALRVLGVQGDSALGHGPAASQDFTFINQEQFAFAKSGEFVDFVVAASGGNAALLKYLFTRYGLRSGLKRLATLVQTMGKPFGGFASSALFSAVPIACGPYAVRVRLLPAPGNGPADPQAKKDWAADVAARLARQDLQWDLQLQPFVSEQLTPIEDASINWPSPYTTVACLTLPRQDLHSAAGQAFAQQVESAVFDPWQALAAHRPLGDVQRARKVVYYESQKGRGAA